VTVGPEAFDYWLPDELIAQHPAARRGDARMLTVDGTGELRHARARELQSWIERDTLVVVNDSKVVPARIIAHRDDGKRFELLVCEPRIGLVKGSRVAAWLRPGKRGRAGDLLRVTDVCSNTQVLLVRLAQRDTTDPRAWWMDILEGDVMAALERCGAVALPPYIARAANLLDTERYQTVYATDPGSIAAPTAGLHLEPELLRQLDCVSITLHVGPGTFLPMNVADVRDHKIRSERVVLTRDAAHRIEGARAQGRRILAVGTTVVRALETVAALHAGDIAAGCYDADLVIGPDHEFHVVDDLLTNFHLPRSSLLMLVCSFGGRERILRAYEQAVRERYRFFSYGDCMLVRKPM